MKENNVYIIAAILGVVFALLAGYYNFSPARYVLNNYGIIGLLIYGIIGTGFFGILLYKIHTTRSKRTVNILEKEKE